MENFGDLIYIVVLAVIGITSLLSAGKKKQAEEEMSKMQIPPDVVTPQTASGRDFRNIPFLAGESEIARAIRMQTSSFNDPEEEEGQEPLVAAEDFDNPESLRKAVIYSEILNRKY
ncbi:MAG: hypothetical protein LBV32_07500 [Tannerellaceae bacterium]|jgi:hypothetical protein|nr:hypothetical protein [Tannerellaceae bacterium]